MCRNLRIVVGFIVFMTLSAANAQNYENKHGQNLGDQGQGNKEFHRPYQGMMQDPIIMRNPQMMQLQQQIMLDLQEVRANRDRLNQSMMRLQQHRMEMMQLRQKLMQQKGLQNKPMMNQKPGLQNEYMRKQKNYKQQLREEMHGQPMKERNQPSSSSSSGGMQ